VAEVQGERRERAATTEGPGGRAVPNCPHPIFKTSENEYEPWGKKRVKRWSTIMSTTHTQLTLMPRETRQPGRDPRARAPASPMSLWPAALRTIPWIDRSVGTTQGSRGKMNYDAGARVAMGDITSMSDRDKGKATCRATSMPRANAPLAPSPPPLGEVVP